MPSISRDCLSGSNLHRKRRRRPNLGPRLSPDYKQDRRKHDVEKPERNYQAGIVIVITPTMLNAETVPGTIVGSGPKLGSLSGRTKPPAAGPTLIVPRKNKVNVTMPQKTCYRSSLMKIDASANMRSTPPPPECAEQYRHHKNPPDDPTSSHDPILPPPPALERTIEWPVPRSKKQESRTKKPE